MAQKDIERRIKRLSSLSEEICDLVREHFVNDSENFEQKNVKEMVSGLYNSFVDVVSSISFLIYKYSNSADKDKKGIDSNVGFLQYESMVNSFLYGEEYIEKNRE